MAAWAQEVIELDEVVVAAPGAEGATASTSLAGPPPPAYAGGEIASGVKLGALGNRNVFDTPFSVTGLTDELIEDRIVTNVQDIARFDSGITPNTNPGVYYDSFTIRGFTSNTLFDGIVGPFQRGTTLSLEAYDRVEIIKGPLGTLTAPVGFGAGGVVNLVPKRAGDEPITSIETRYLGGEVLGIAGDLSRRFGPGDSVGARIVGAFEAGDSVVDGQTIRNAAGHLALDWEGERARVVLDLDAVHAEADGTTPLVYLAPGVDVPDPPELDRSYSQPWTDYPRQRIYAVARGEFDVTDDITVGTVYSTFRHNESGEYDGRIDVVDNDGNYTFETSLGYNYVITGWEHGAYVKGDVDTGPISHSLTVDGTIGGYDGDFTPYDAFRVASNFDDPVTVPRPDDVETRDFLTWLDRDRRSILIADEIGLLDDRVLLTVAGRYTWLRSRRGNFATNEVTQVIENDAVTPIVGIVGKPLDWLSVYASYAEGIEYGRQAPATAANALAVTEAIGTEQFEVGIKADFGTVGVTAALFDIVRDTAFTDPVSNVYGLNGRQRHRGFEVSAFGEVRPGTTVIAGLTVLDPKLEKTVGGAFDGNDAPGVPTARVVANIKQSLNPWVPGLSVWAGVQWTNSFYYDAANTREVDGFATLDLGIDWKLAVPVGKEAAFRLAVTNVTDERYWRPGGDESLIVGDPLTVRATAQMKF